LIVRNPEQPPAPVGGGIPVDDPLDEARFRETVMDIWRLERGPLFKGETKISADERMARLKVLVNDQDFEISHQTRVKILKEENLLTQEQERYR
jgi:hypothetical protein